MTARKLTELDNKILEVIKEKKRIKADEIADILKVEKKKINQTLYSDALRDFCIQDSDYYWSLKEEKEHDADKEKRIVDEKLSNLCNYYLNCLSLEGIRAVNAYRDSRIPSYSELSTLNFSSSENLESHEFLNGANNSNLSTFFIGYPLLVHEYYSENSDVPSWKIYPVFISKIENENGTYCISDTITLNQDVVSCYSNLSLENSIYETMRLDEELGLSSINGFSNIDDVVLRLKMLRPHWEWVDELDDTSLNNITKLNEINKNGIYNKAVLLYSEKQRYTDGLEDELLQLSKYNLKDYKETALYKFVYGATNENDVFAERQLLEVLPLNIEQKEAIQKALVKDVMVATGPPGTGKSQIVSDLIINMVVADRTVLFSSKNNKAVNVVNERVNEIGKIPVIARVGGQTKPYDLIKALTELISSKSSVKKEEFDLIVSEYNKIVKEYDELNREKESFINTRNSLDKLEQNYCEIRNEYSRLWDRIEEISISKISEMLRGCVYNYQRTIRCNQNIVVRILWFIFEKKRVEVFSDSLFEINSYLKSKEIQTELTEDAFYEKVETLENTIKSLNLLSEYKERLEYFLGLESLEDIDYKLFEKTKELADKAKELWNKRILYRASEITSKNKSKILDYITALKLMEGQGVKLSAAQFAQLKRIQEDVIKLFPCGSITSLSAKGRIPLLPGLYDLVIIDEASQCDIASIIPLLFRAKRVAVIGDKKQLQHISNVPNYKDIKLIEKFNIPFKWSYTQNSFYDLAYALIEEKSIVNLRDHHRSHSDIIQFSNNEFYDGQLRIATNYSKLSKPNTEDFGIKWIDCKGEVYKPKSGSYVNKLEAKRIKKELENIVKTGFDGSIGVVTPFRAQADYIRYLVEKDTELYLQLQKNELIIDTVHKYQGDEKDVIIFSTVVSDGISESAIGFLESTGNIFNVAITRARSILIVVGNKNECARCKVEYLNHFVRYVDDLENKTVQRSMPDFYGVEYPEVDNPEDVSEWEKILYRKLFESGMYTIPQYSEDKYRLDLALLCGDRKLDIEVDGASYHKDWSGELCYRDKLRNQRMFELNWDVKRFWVYQIRDNLDECVDIVRDWYENAKGIS